MTVDSIISFAAAYQRFDDNIVIILVCVLAEKSSIAHDRERICNGFRLNGIMENFVRVKLLFFAKSRELAGLSECEIDLPETILYSKLVEYLSDTFSLQSLEKTFLVALNSDYCEESDIPIQLKNGDELAVIPPISGG